MKIRIKGNSLRYRLTRPEVERFASDGYLEDTTDFGATRLTYSLQRITGGNLSACFENNNITIYMPHLMLQEWSTTERVGFENTDQGLYLLIEKDFMCLDLPAAEQADNYPNPLMMSK
ncbi:hypothetical protein HQ865_15535 [Mucilaginibacter mali]|uniref:Uncharacterized protein n=1 Tax=Mucilaginibacter mali TaxID=2740462 RepID=A0A7D4Q4M9_9SPHI|nr:hypothetical protein [Mucilaginibacter mali]QKJ31107.1 hypothetical protein HQ865_15535 [Mucilaginibacter mali]